MLSSFLLLSFPLAVVLHRSEVRGLGPEVKGRLCVIGAESEVWSQESEDESGRIFISNWSLLCLGRRTKSLRSML